MPTKSKPTPHVLLDHKIPIEQRKQLLAEICRSESKESTRLLESIFKAAASGSSETLYGQKKKELDELIDAIQSGPQRPGWFLGLLSTNGASVKRAHVRLEDGTTTCPVVLDDEMLAGVHRGDCVLLSTRAEAILAAEPLGMDVGEEARLEGWIDDRVEVSLRSDERHVLYLSHRLQGKLESGEVRTGAPLLVCLRRQMAFDAVPRATDEWARFRFLDRSEIPDVVAERDIGDPPAFIADVIDFCRREMAAAPRRRKYGLRRCRTYLLSGVSGSGKTLSICACIRGLCEVMSELTGLPIDELPPRIIRVKMSKVLSMWLGESDKNADRLVDEIVELAGCTVTGPAGEFEAPVIVVLEELDGIARRRGGDHDGVYDRIQTTLLQRLDHTANRALRDRLIVMLATTNVPHLIDTAWLRRVGGEMVPFGRLRRRAFAAVLTKQLGDIPVAAPNGHGESIRQSVVRDVTAALFSPNGADWGLVEVQLAGTAGPCVKHRRDFLTGSIVDRAVQQAAERACREEEAVRRDSGITAEMLVEAITGLIRSVVGALTPGNVTDFVDLPDGARVTNVRRLDEPALLPTDLFRNR